MKRVLGLGSRRKTTISLVAFIATVGFAAGTANAATWGGGRGYINGTHACPQWIMTTNHPACNPYLPPTGMSPAPVGAPVAAPPPIAKCHGPIPAGAKNVANAAVICPLATGTSTGSSASASTTSSTKAATASSSPTLRGTSIASTSGKPVDSQCATVNNGGAAFLC